MALGGGPRPHRTEFDETTAFAGLTRRPPMADGKTDKAARTAHKRSGVAKIAGRDSADLGAEIEPLVKRFGYLAAGGLDRAPVGLGQLGIARPVSAAPPGRAGAVMIAVRNRA